MTVYLALLRAVNVGGHKKIAMAELRELLDQLGFGDARSLFQSGNLKALQRGHGPELEHDPEARCPRPGL